MAIYGENKVTGAPRLAAKRPNGPILALPAPVEFG